MVIDTSIDEGPHLGHSSGGPRDRDPLRRVVQALLILYLAPVFLLVFATGAVLIAVLGVFKAVVWATSFVNPGRRRLATAATLTRYYQGLNSAPAHLSGRASQTTALGTVRKHASDDKFRN